MPYLEALKFNLVGYGCTTCIGNSGPLPEAVAEAVQKENLVVAAVLSGNRNFEGRINPQVKANYLASPPLVVAYALAGTVDIDLTTDPLGHGSRRQAGLPARHLAVQRRGARAPCARPSTARCSSTNTRTSSTATRTGRAMPVPTGDIYRVGRAIHLHQEAALLRPYGGPRQAAERSRRHARAGAAGRFGHHRPHLAGRLDPEETARRASI